MQRMDKEEEVVEIPPYKKYVAEFIGTFVLVLIGCGSAVIAGGQIGFLGISFAFGIAVLAMVYAIGPISGCHINPAITVAMLIAKKIKALDAAIYIIVQIVGAIFAAGVLFAIASGNGNYSLSEKRARGQQLFVGKDWQKKEVREAKSISSSVSSRGRRSRSLSPLTEIIAWQASIPCT